MADLLSGGPNASAAGGSLGGSAVGSSMPTSPPAPYPAPTPQQGTQGVNQNQGGQGWNYGMVGVQGTGYVPQNQQGDNSVGGFQTAGYQYGMAPSGGIQGSTINNSGQYNTSNINAAQMPVGSVQNGQQYYNPAQDAYVNQARRSLDPQWSQSQEQQESQLTNMGLTRGSDAWNTAMQNFNLAKNDAYSTANNQGIMNAGAEAARMQGMDVTAGNFANQAAQQNYQNQLTSQQAYNTALTGQQALDTQAGTFANAAQQQGYQQQLGRAQLNNAAMGQQQGFQTQQDVGMMGLEGQQAQAGATASAAASNAAASMYGVDQTTSANRAIAAGQQAIQGGQLDLATNAQNYYQYQNMQDAPINRQTQLLQNNQLTNPGNLPAQPNRSVSAPGYSGVLTGQQGANTQVGSGTAGMINNGLSLGGTALQQYYGT